MAEAQDITKSNSIPTGYKQTAIGVIPEEWSLRKIEDLFGFIRTNSLSRNSLNYEYSEDSIFNIHYGDIHSTYQTSILNFDIEQEIPVVISKDFVPNNSDFLIEGDVVIADASEDYEGVGKAIEIQNIKGRKALAGLHTFALRAKSNETALGFRTYIFKHPKVSKTIKVIATGTKVYGVSKFNFATLNVILPPLPEQQKIAEILSTWDEAIILTKITIEELKLRNKGLAQQLLTGKKRLNGFSGDWKEVKLGNVLNFHKQKSKNGDEYPVFSSSKTGLIMQSDYYGGNNRITEREIDGFNVIPPGYITYRSRSDDGVFTFNQNNFNITGVVSKYYPVFTTKSSSTEFIVNLLNKNWHHIGRYAVGTSQLVLGEKDLKNISFKLPDIKEQKAIISILNSGDEELKIQQQKLEFLQEQKKGLMQKLLTGEKRVKI